MGAPLAHQPRHGLPVDVRFRDLRDTCAALLIANGRHMEEIKEHLGQSSIRVISDRYGHLFPSARGPSRTL
jgi:integrase